MRFPFEWTVKCKTRAEWEEEFKKSIQPALGGKLNGWGYSWVTKTLYLIIKCKNGSIMDICIPLPIDDPEESGDGV